MAVFTPVSPTDFAHWAKDRYALAGACTLTPIAEGIENTNYRVTHTPPEGGDQQFVFTIFELWDTPAVAYYTALMHHLATAGLPIPPAIQATDGTRHSTWQDKPCVLVPFIPGADQPHPTPAACRQMGDLIARMHLAASTFPADRPNPRDAAWRHRAAPQIRPHLPPAQQTLIDAAMVADARFAAAPLPAGACHCDLFRNNVLWQDNAVTAVIDFYFGGTDSLIFDLAVCACDWCAPPAATTGNTDDSGELDSQRLAALVGGYHARRPLCELEKTLFADALAAAATRFWLSRHRDILHPRSAHTLTPHDPAPFGRLLAAILARRDALNTLASAAA